MNILGYSGLNDSIKFRKEHLEGLTEQEYRMCQGLDSSACIISNGEIVAAAEEERFNGEKYTCNFPINAINYCLRESKLEVDDLDFICHGFDYEAYSSIYKITKISQDLYNTVLSPNVQRNLWLKHFPKLDISKFVAVDHHLAHAATAFYPSGFKSALILVADGIGETYSLSLFDAHKSGIRLLRNCNLMSSLGVLYSQVTYHLGFWVNSDEYKIMGLAPYGDSKTYQALFDELIEYRDDGTIHIDKFALNKTDLERQTGRGFRRWLSNRAFPERHPEEPIRQKHKDFAASLQSTVEKSLLHILNYWQKVTNATNLCMAGGVALNCTANGIIFRSHLFEDMFIQSAASDSGTSLGAGLVKSYSEDYSLKKNLSYRYRIPNYGPSFGSKVHRLAIAKFLEAIHFVELDTESLIKEAANWIANQKVIAWMQGGMEFGPRALGHRSILADPSNAYMRQHINALVKKREAFRPFAPSVTLESAHKYFEIPENQEFPHMLYTVKVRASYREKLPAITHVDGTVRIQTVNKQHAKLYWTLLREIEKKTGYPIALNTSFNVKGQPIVCTPEEAIRTLIETNIDALFMGNFLITIKIKT